MNQAQLNFLNQFVLNQAKDLRYIVKNEAPNTEIDLFNSSSLIIWSGGSDTTIYQDRNVNYAFRAWHDSLHLKTGLGFTVADEIELGRIQASQCGSSFVADLVYCEISLQAAYFLEKGQFVADQLQFTMDFLRGKNY